MSVGLYYDLMRLHHNDFGERSEQRFTSMLINVLILPILAKAASRGLRVC